MPRRLAQQQMTLGDLEWPFHASRAISAAAELPVEYCVHVCVKPGWMCWARFICGLGGSVGSQNFQTCMSPDGSGRVHCSKYL